MPSALINEGIEFDEDAHRYTVNGKVYPSVTGILKLWSKFGYTNFDATDAMWRGTVVHRATELWDQDDLDESSVEPEIMAYVRGWQKFRRDWQFTPGLIEARVAHLTWGYAGTLDRTGYGQQPGKRPAKCYLLDIKSGAPDPSHALQTMGYYLPLHDCKAIIDARLTVYLSPDDYKVEVHPNDTADRANFLAAVAFYKWRKQHNLGESL